MNRMQKTAWWMVGWISAGAIFAAFATAILFFIADMPWSKAQGGLGFLGIAGLGGLAPLIFKKDPGKVTCDERDRLINNRAAASGFLAAFLITGIICMLPFFVLGPKATISITWLPMIFMTAGLASFLVHSIAILSQYGRESKGEKP
jgi:hypothetical protein